MTNRFNDREIEEARAAIKIKRAAYDRAVQQVRSNRRLTNDLKLYPLQTQQKLFPPHPTTE